jgi:hypothetical protein
MKRSDDRQLILALFHDRHDESVLLPLLEGIPHLLSGSLLPPPGELSARLGVLELSPALIIISTGLYPDSRRDLVAELKGLYPGAEFMLVTPAAGPLPTLPQLSADRIGHLLVVPTDDVREGAEAVRGAVDTLLAGRPWSLLECVGAGGVLREFTLRESREKEAVIAALEYAIAGDSPDMELLRQRAALLADEMVENALYGAPRDAAGRKLYRKGEERSVAPTEMISFRFAYDGETLAMEVADGWGTLSPESVVDFLARNQDGIGIDPDETGGRGLFIIWKFFDHLHVRVSPGERTLLGGHLRAGSPLDIDSPKGFSIVATHP